jgi:hypothetical protein
VDGLLQQRVCGSGKQIQKIPEPIIFNRQQDRIRLTKNVGVSDLSGEKAVLADELTASERPNLLFGPVFPP